MGWNLEGLSVITRVQKDMLHDLEVAPVQNTNSDRLALDGNRLNVVSGTYGQAGSTYRLEADNFSTITMYDSGPNRWFRVVTKDGTEMDYGGTSDSRFLTNDGTQVMLWRLNRIKDVNGNYIDFEYTSWFTNTRQTLISKIRYTGNWVTGLQPYNEIYFKYTLPPQLNKIYEGGSSIQLEGLVKEVEVRGENNQMFKTYVFNYGHNYISPFLKEVIEKDANGNGLNSTIFKYENKSPVEIFYAGGQIGDALHADFFGGDFDGDGLPEIVSAVKSVTDNMTHTSEIKINKEIYPGALAYSSQVTIPFSINFTDYKKENTKPILLG